MKDSYFGVLRIH